MMQKYFIQIAYDGSNYSGWQKQEQGQTIQGQIEAIFSKLYNRDIAILGCGRTDAGVHASQYFFHVEIELEKFTETDLIFKLNNMLGNQIQIVSIYPVEASAHARFDATRRSYEYNLTKSGSPFERHYNYRPPMAERLDIKKLNDAAGLILNYSDFFPFCKTHSDVRTYTCKIFRSEWKPEGEKMVFHISADRFLRGMVRLIVGMCLNYNYGKLSLASITNALDKQTRLETSLSVPAHALFLTEVNYPYIE